MLGGSFWVAALRNSISAALMMLVFLLLDRPRFSMKKTVWCYGIYWVLLITGFSIWYALDQEGFVRASGMMAIPAVGFLKFRAFTGTGFAHPSPVSSRRREPKRSRWARGFRVVRPISRAVGSPIQAAAMPWAHS